MKRFAWLILACILAGTASAKDCAPRDIDDVLGRARAMAGKNRPVEAEKLLEGAWAACGAEIQAKGDAKQDARRRDFLLDWLDLAARTKRTSSCVKVQGLLEMHLGDLAEHAPRVSAAKRRCQADPM
jgi:hypothetical protein